MLVIADAIAFEGGVDDGELLEGDDGGADEKGHEGEARAIALLEAVFEFVAQADDAGHVHFEHAVDVSAGAAGFDHALGDDFAHLRHGNEVAGNGGGRGGAAGASRAWSGTGAEVERAQARNRGVDEVEDVLLGDAAAGAGAGDLSEIDVVLAGEFADKRGGADVRFVVVFSLDAAGAGTGAAGADASFTAGAGGAAGLARS